MSHDLKKEVVLLLEKLVDLISHNPAKAARILMLDLQQGAKPQKEAEKKKLA